MSPALVAGEDGVTPTRAYHPLRQSSLPTHKGHSFLALRTINTTQEVDEYKAKPSSKRNKSPFSDDQLRKPSAHVCPVWGGGVRGREHTGGGSGEGRQRVGPAVAQGRR